MKKVLPMHIKKHKMAIDLWLRVATDVNAGIEPKDIAKRYINSKTGKPYTREHIYWIIRQVKGGRI